jgi:hypothetical protein
VPGDNTELDSTDRTMLEFFQKNFLFLSPLLAVGISLIFYFIILPGIFTNAGNSDTPFYIMIEPEGKIAAPGDQIQAQILVKRIKMYDQPVTLTASNVPRNMEISFVPQSAVIPEFGSMMKLVIGSNATKKNSTIIIRCTGPDGKNNTSEFQINILNREEIQE